MDVQRYGPSHRDGACLEAVYSVAGALFRFRVPAAAFAAAWPHHVGLGDGDPTELCTDERLDALAAASFGYLAGARLLVQNLADGLGGTPVLHVTPEAGWFAVVAARIGGRG